MREQFDGDPSLQCMLIVMHGRIGSCFEECSKSCTHMVECMNTPCPTVLSLRLTCNATLICNLSSTLTTELKNGKEVFNVQFTRFLLKTQEFTKSPLIEPETQKLSLFIPNAKFCDHSDPSLTFWSPVQSHHIRQMAARQAKEPQVACWIYHDLNMRTPNLFGRKTPQSSRCPWI